MAGFTLHHFFSNEADILRGIGAPCEVQPKNLDLEREEKNGVCNGHSAYGAEAVAIEPSTASKQNQVKLKMIIFVK